MLGDVFGWLMKGAIIALALGAVILAVLLIVLFIVAFGVIISGMII